MAPSSARSTSRAARAARSSSSAGGLEAARDYYKEQLPKHGFELGEGDAEEEEAETEFDGHGFEGHLKLRTIEGCANALSLGVVLRPKS